MSDYKNYLAAVILTEQKIVTYRILSRALKVHVNIAKEMLFEFHEQQRMNKPGTINATYLIIGSKQEEVLPGISKEADLGSTEDGGIQSSPFTCSPSPTLDESTRKSSVKTITLVREADLEKVRSKYDHIDSIHIYSLGLYPVKDLQILSDDTRELKPLCSEEDVLNSSSTYGTIKNKNVKLRCKSKPGLVAQSSSVKTTSTLKSVHNNNPTIINSKFEPKTVQLPSTLLFPSGSKIKTSASVVISSPDDSTTNQTTVNSLKTKKHEKDSIISAFSRTESKQKHEKKRNQAPEKLVTSISEDRPSKDVLPDDNDDDLNDDRNDEIWAPIPSSAKEINSNQKSKKEREEALKKMMDDDTDEDEKSAVSELASSKIDETAQKEVSSETREQAVKTGIKRRYRRRIMKKKTFKDEEGYLVTKQEPAWESFSEDEILPNHPIVKAQLSTTSKAKKGTVGKSGQGNIMSFFGKK